MEETQQPGNTGHNLTDEDIFGQTQPDYAGFWLRLVAWILDTIIIWLATIPLRLITGYHQPQSLTEFYTANLSYSGVSILFNWLYFSLMESSSMQATLGKRALGIYVTDDEGRQLTFAKATGRYFAKFISAIILYVGFIIAGFTKKKQALHDIIAGTLVVR